MPLRRARGAELPSVIRGLLRPGAYPHPIGRVRLVQTHISYVLLAGEYVYKALFELARPLLLDGRSVILDATFLRRQHRRWATRLARETGAQFACLELRISDRAARERLDRRARRGAGVSDARWETYRAQKGRFQRPSEEVPPEQRIAIEAERPLRSQVRDVGKALGELSPLSVQR